MPTTAPNENRSSNDLTGSPTEEFLKTVLNRAANSGLLVCRKKDGEESEKISVESVQVEGGGVIGENYGSSMTYAIVKVRTHQGVKDMGIVIKNLKDTPWHVEIMNIFVLFEKEVEFFNRTVPAIIRFQAKRGVARSITELLPRCLYAKAEKDGGMIITENICHQGFKMAERRHGLGLKHSTITIEALARFHAASLTMKLLEPEAFWEAFKNAQREASFTEDRKIIFDSLYKQISRGKILSMARAEAENGASDANLLLKMAEVGEEILRNRGQLAIDFLKNYREPLAVFCHGDFWVNNFMFRYETNKSGETTPVAVKILDFQMTRYASPALDILTFLYTSTTQELREAHEEDLLRAYHNALLEAIREAGIDPVSDFACEGGRTYVKGNTSVISSAELPDGHPLSYSSLKEDLRRHGPWALMIAEMMLRIVMANSSEAADTMEATIMNGTEVEGEEDKMVGYEMLRQLTTAEYSARMFQVFRELAHKGYLVVNDLDV